MGNTIKDVGSWLNANVWRPVEKGLFNYQENVDKYVGQVVNWNPAEVTTSDRAAAVLTLFTTASPVACEQQEESSKPAEEDIGQSKDVAAEVSQKPKGWVFCAKEDVIENDDNCFKNKDIQDKMSSCVYLNGIFQGQGELEELYYDHDKLMSYLLGGPPNVEWINGSNFVFTGNKEWPQDFLDKGTSFFKEECSPSQTLTCNYEFWWEAFDDYKPRGYLIPPTIAKILPDKSTWSAQVWFRQPPDLCWAVYETPCADESVCE